MFSCHLPHTEEETSPGFSQDRMHRFGFIAVLILPSIPLSILNWRLALFGTEGNVHLWCMAIDVA